jgi:hypothetical protein
MRMSFSSPDRTGYYIEGLYVKLPEDVKEKVGK